mmetsp:Transcript_8052/g.14188  ORF Transcript_8052/g.14188 Transcript_8052/m.14188 type:complete len:285 (-) Transcript_8052:587-1441(-)
MTRTSTINPIDDGETTKCSNSADIIKSISMVRRSISNPLLMIRPFSTAARRRKNIPCEPDEKNSSRQQDRKVSIDQTVLSGDESRLLNSSHNSRSFDVDASVDTLHPNFSHGFVAEEHGVADTMKASRSEPSFLTHYPYPDDICPCRDCSLSVVPSQDQQLRYLANYYPALAPLPSSAARPDCPNPQQPSSPKSNDPAFQARTEGIIIQQEILGENHPDVIFALSSLAKLHQRRGNYIEAASILRESQMRSMQAKSTPHFFTKSRQNPQEEPSVPLEISFSHLS